MPLMVMTGGARSGKSTAAQSLALERATAGDEVLVAVFGSAEGDPEMAARIAAHRAGRPEAFKTFEVDDPVSWTASVSDDVVLVLDCLGTLLGRIMSDALVADSVETDSAAAPAFLPANAALDVERSFEAIVDWLIARGGATVVVTNEVGDGVVPTHASGRLFRDLLGKANRRLVTAADAAYLVTCGRLVDLTALPSSASWPGD